MFESFESPSYLSSLHDPVAIKGGLDIAGVGLRAEEEANISAQSRLTSRPLILTSSLPVVISV